MTTLNNQLIQLGMHEGDEVLMGNCVARVILNEFGLGLSIKSSHQPRALCDGWFPEITSLRPWKRKRRLFPCGVLFQSVSTFPSILRQPRAERRS